MFQDTANKIYLLLLTLVIILVLIGISTNYYLQMNNIKYETKINLENYNNRFKSYIDEESNMMKSILTLIGEKQTLQTSYLNNNKELLYKDSLEIFQHLSQNSEITHFYFIKPNGEVFLRVHDFLKDRDIVKRFTFQKAKETNKIFYGLEFGIKKNYTLRTVFPWIIDGKTIGFIEIGKEIDKLSETLSKELGIEIFYAINKNIYKNEIKYNTSPQTKRFYIAYQTIAPDREILDYLNIDSSNRPYFLAIDGKNYIAYKNQLKDVSGALLGYELLLVDISKKYTDLLKSIIYYTAIMVLGTFLMLLVIYMFLKRKQKILDQALLELELKNLEQKNLLILFDKGDSVLFKWKNDSNWSIHYVSSNVINLLGYTKEEFLNSKITYAKCIHKDDLERVFKEVQQGQLSQDDFFVHEPYRIVTKDGVIKWVLDYTVLDRDTNHKIIHFLGYILDITKNQENELKIEAQKEEFEAIFKFSKDGIAIVDLESNFLEFNDAYLKMTGFTREELLTKSCLELTAPEYLEKSRKAFEVVFQEGYIENFEKNCIVNNGKRIITNMSISMLPDKQRLLIMIKDLTDIKLLEDQSKLASMGEMIGNIAHQWRQPLSLISTNATGLMMQQEYGLLTDEKLNTACNQINDYAQYLSKTIDDFRNFIKGDPNFCLINVSQVIHEALNIVDATIKGNYINLQVSIEDDLMINGNKNELEQAFINILNNSKDVLQEKVQEDERAIYITTKLIDHNKLSLKFCDNGGGIPIDIIDKIFEPYFTTKHQSQGTGLGLSMVNKIIRERHNQKLTVYNSEFDYQGKKYTGTCFEIIFTA